MRQRSAAPSLVVHLTQSCCASNECIGNVLEPAALENVLAMPGDPIGYRLLDVDCKITCV